VHAEGDTSAQARDLAMARLRLVGSSFWRKAA